MENPDVDVFEVRDITDIGSASERYGSGKELRALVDEVPDTVSAEGESSEVDSFRISNSGGLKKIVQKGENGFSGAGHPCLPMIALWSDEDARAFGNVSDE